ncbi:MAG: molybdopterin-dependent oxidoreductase, partial [Myxococcaceae bacterium]
MAERRSTRTRGRRDVIEPRHHEHGSAGFSSARGARDRPGATFATSEDVLHKELRTTCNRDCPDSCGIIATVEDGRVVGHRGDPLHGVTQGVLCSRGNEYLRRQYHADRVLHPMRRTRGGGFERISWDSALDLTAEHLGRLRDTLGPQAVLAVSYSGLHTWVTRVLWRRFWAHFGGPTLVRGGLSVEAVGAAQEMDFGADGTHEPEDHVNAKALVLWGKNIAVTRQHSLRFVKEARRAGATLAVIDPVHNTSARLADRFFQLRPGSDGVLALGVARLLIERGAVDEAFVAAHTSGFEAFRRLTLSRSVEEVARETDLPVSAVGELAELYATRKPLATFIGLGPSYWANGAAQVRCIDALAAISGNLGVAGGGANSDLGRDAGLDLSA